MKEIVWCFSYIKEMTLCRNFMELYKLLPERNAVARINQEAQALLNQNKYILYAQK